MKPLVGDHIETLKPYVPGKPIEELRRARGITTEIVKLASNENPLGGSPLALAAAHKAIEEAHLYPDGAVFDLRQRLGKHLGVSPERVVAGNGSNELMEILVRTFTAPGDNVVLSQYSFIAYRIVSQVLGLDIRSVPMAKGFVHDLGAMAQAVDERTRLVFTANPNNPTGTYNNADQVKDFLQTLAARPNPPLVIVDEAYIEFVDAEDHIDSMTLHDLYPRLITMRTFSKIYGLAAFRVGYMVCSEEIAGYVNRTRAPFNVNRIGQIAATAALDDMAFVERAASLNTTERARVTTALEAMGVEVIHSQTNFVLCRCGRPGFEIYDALLDLGTITRPMNGYGLHEWVRISIGTPEQNDRLLSDLAQVLKS